MTTVGCTSSFCPTMLSCNTDFISHPARLQNVISASRSLFSGGNERYSSSDAKSWVQSRKSAHLAGPVCGFSGADLGSSGARSLLKTRGFCSRRLSMQTIGCCQSLGVKAEVSTTRSLTRRRPSRRAFQREAALEHRPGNKQWGVRSEAAKVGESHGRRLPGSRRRLKTSISAVAPSVSSTGLRSRDDRRLQKGSKALFLKDKRGPEWLKGSGRRNQTSGRSLGVRSSSGLVVTTADFGSEAAGVGVDDEVQDFGLNEDVILANVPVQSKEEQEKLARTPAHPLALRWMFAAYTANCFAERTFRFAVPAVIGLLSNSLLPIAIISFVGQVGVFALGPIIGDLLDETPRLPALRVLATMQITSMVASACVTLYAFHSGASACVTAGQLIRRPWFVFLTLAGVVERLAGIASGVAYERDWVVQLAGPNRHIALAESNALLRRLDIGSEIVGPFSLGLVLSRFTPAVSLGIAAFAVAAFLPLQLLCIYFTDKISRGALRRYSLEQRAREANPPVRKSPFEALANGWRLYLAQPVLPASIAYVMLYFNAVLSPGGLITSFLTTQGISPQVVGGFRGACALFGFAATFLSAWAIKKVGVLSAGAFALIFQAACLALSVLVYFGRPAGAASGAFMMGFLALIVLSRLGLWTYDIVDTQVFQTAIPDSHISVVSTTELSLCSLAELVMLGVAMVAEDPRHFGGLAALSMTAVVGATAVYLRWVLRPCATKRELFGFGAPTGKEAELSPA